MRLSTSRVEEQFIGSKGFANQASKVPYIIVDSFPDLGLITTLRFFEWVFNNPEGVISLPTGKTPEYFIKWTQCLVFLKELTVEDFLNTSRTLEESIEGSLVK